MHTQSVILPLNEDAAKVYQGISVSEREKIHHVLKLLLSRHRLLPDFLSLLMDAISLRARQRGLTEEKREELLRDGESRE
uniref:Uncharacterized protein n=1 Tax=Candidatus Kentrum sp. DK TaxID=2126562 RepID=A0A450S551_9GAMM|nr:MAG: hypothetical protein BECKDK2373C_GA0170839_100216 [Candidatus Kentron sp. DK]VFJ47024.1 MAG: hypothetical protein BECKDK2373B_GA0170837_10159 [Candidatus Kentron sp. DK]